MKKNIYVAPTIMVVKIQQSTALLLGSDVYSTPADGSSILGREAEFSDWNEE